MDYFTETCAIITFIEKRIKERLEFKELEKSLNFSYRHIREIFRKKTNIPLSQYILARKIANCALEIISTPKSLTDIAAEYGFGSYDTFTRAFKRQTGIRPSELRSSGLKCDRKPICSGVFAPVIYNINDSKSALRIISEVEIVEKALKTQDSCILYGVPKVFYGRNFDGGWQGTPFPMCLQAVLDYMGQNVHYSYLMAASGASFRFRWNVNGWDLSAVDIRNIYENSQEAFVRSFKAVGRKYRIIEKADGTKEEFMSLIKEEIDQGRPLIALGVVGPPEAGIITGYMNKGESILGWSLFQNDMGFSGDLTFDESGYYICNNWWENIHTIMSVGEETQCLVTAKELLRNALRVLSDERIQVDGGKGGTYYGGQRAYSAWADALGDSAGFPKEPQLTMLLERIMCFGDAATMVGEGRSYAAGYISWVGETFPETNEECIKCAEYFNAAAGEVTKMQEVLVNFWGEEAAGRLAQKENRTKLAALINEAGQWESKAAEELIRILQKL